MKWFESVSKPQVRAWLGRHSLFWLFYVVYFTFSSMPSVGGLLVSFETCLLHVPLNMLFVYLMIYKLIPKLLSGKYTQFLILVAGFLLLSLVVNYLFRALVLIPFRTGKPIPLVNTAYLTIFATLGFIMTQSVVWVAVGIKLVRYWYQKERATQQVARETLTVELQMLKAQIHPHFLFNTLNNLYSLTLKQSSQAPDTVLKLSGLLHYMLHECNRPTVLLTKEIDFLTNYIELEKLRYGNRLVVTTAVGGAIQDKVIAPLLLIPFLENAFKHGSSQQMGQAQIDLRLWVQGDEMTFRLENSTDSIASRTSSTRSARLDHNQISIGLTNVRKRLQLIYPGAHTLSIQPENGHFLVNLMLNLAGASDSQAMQNSRLSHLIR